MRIVVRENTLGDLADDLAGIPVELAFRLPLCVLRNAKHGNRMAKGFAKSSAGKHGKHYPDAFTVEKTGALAYEYGPDSAKPQGGMSFEFGSRNQPPHLDLAKSADAIGPKFAGDVMDEVEGAFW